MKYVLALALAIPFAMLAEDFKLTEPARTETRGVNKTLTKEQMVVIEARRAERRAAGFVTIKDEGKSVVFYDMRLDKSVDIAPELTKMQQFMGISLETAPAEKTDGNCPMKFALNSVSDGKCSAAIVLANCGENPTLVTCPEDKIGIINVDRLAKDADKDVFKKRLYVELWRISAFVLGGYKSDFPCCMEPVFSPKEIDNIATTMTCPPVSGKIGLVAISFGTAPVRIIPYSNAVRRGIAPNPTNDAQRAIWDRVNRAKTNNVENAANDAQREEVEKWEKAKAARAAATNAPAATAPAK